MLWPHLSYIGIDTGFQNYILAALIGAVFSRQCPGIHLLLRALWRDGTSGQRMVLRYLGERAVAHVVDAKGTGRLRALFNQVSFVLALGSLSLFTA